MVKSTGTLRKIDELGRIVIPMEVRNNLNILEKDPMEIFIDGEIIMLKKHERTCIFCKNSNNLVDIKGKKVCNKCLKEMLKLEV